MRKKCGKKWDTSSSVLIGLKLKTINIHILEWLNPLSSIPRDDIHVYNINHPSNVKLDSLSLNHWYFHGIRLISLPNLVQRNPARHQLLLAKEPKPDSNSSAKLWNRTWTPWISKMTIYPHRRIRKKIAKPNNLKISRVNNPQRNPLNGIFCHFYRGW